VVEGQFALGPRLKGQFALGPHVKNYSEIYINITVISRLPECRIWPFLGPEISKFSQGECPRILLIIVLEYGITSGP
jgi:hypothetical protein